MSGRETQFEQYQRIRRALGWSTQDAARAYGVSEIEMARLERSEVFNDCYHLARFCAAQLATVDYVPPERRRA